MAKLFLLLCLISAPMLSLQEQSPIPGLEGVATVGDKLAVNESFEVLSFPASPANPAQTEVTIGTGSSRRISRVLTFVSDSVFSVSYSQYRTAGTSDFFQKTGEVVDDQFEGKSFTITRQGSTAKVVDSTHGVMPNDDQQRILADLGEAFAWLLATSRLSNSSSETSLVTSADNPVTPAFLLGPLVAVKSIRLTYLSDDPAMGSQTFAVKITIADDCNGTPLILSGRLVLIPKSSMDLQVSGKDVVVPTDICAVVPGYPGCPNPAPPESACRFLAAGVVTNMKLTRTITKMP